MFDCSCGGGVTANNPPPHPSPPGFDGFNIYVAVGLKWILHNVFVQDTVSLLTATSTFIMITSCPVFVYVQCTMRLTATSTFIMITSCPVFCVCAVYSEVDCNFYNHHDYFLFYVCVCAVYNEVDCNFYIHHDYFLSSFPLVIEWLNFDGYDRPTGECNQGLTCEWTRASLCSGVVLTCVGKHVNLGLIEPGNMKYLKNGIGESRGQFDSFERLWESLARLWYLW